MLYIFLQKHLERYYNSMERVVEKTEDGYNTIYIPEMDEHYHSVKGAYTESKHIFVDMGFLHSSSDSPKILEIGFGTGLNAILTLIEADSKNRDVIYDSLELYPLDWELVASMHYADSFGDKYHNLFSLMHNSPWNEYVELTDCFSIRKIKCNFTDVESWYDGSVYDIVYFDAFAPEKQPEMWNISLFRQIAGMMRSGGIFVTYCAKGVIRRALQECGFNVERLPGPPNGKREILRATKI